MTPERISILGAAGSGKSTLARQLGQTLGLPVIHLDQLYWSAGWVEQPHAAFLAQADEAAHGPRWIVEGNYSETYPVRLEHSDMIVWLDLPRSIYFRHVLGRIIGNHGEVRPDVAAGCPERFDIDFLRFVWNYQRSGRAKLEAAVSGYAKGRQIEHLTKPAAVESFRARMASIDRARRNGRSWGRADEADTPPERLRKASLDAPRRVQ